MSDRTNRLEKLAWDTEKYMTYLGVSAIEDKIQKEVPKTISTLMSGGIKIWVLTGDK